MPKKSTLTLLALILLAVSPQISHSHCQVPCGIYDDAARIARMYEDAATIEKAMIKMQELVGKTDVQSANQLMRWIATKENHAANIITTVAEYFLTQKVKPVKTSDEGSAAYLGKLADHHRVMVAAMKAKQNGDLEHVATLREALDGLGQHYETEHLHKR